MWNNTTTVAVPLSSINSITAVDGTVYQYYDEAWHTINSNLSNVVQPYIYQHTIQAKDFSIATKEEEANFDRTKELDEFLDSFPII